LGAFRARTRRGSAQGLPHHLSAIASSDSLITEPVQVRPLTVYAEVAAAAIEVAS
jgi:hypothetical protein